MASGPMVNIPRDVEDSFYRYKMPVLKAKVEGKGNGIKTVIENMAEIAKAMDRPVEYPVKFFGFELGALTKADVPNSKFIVNGKHDAENLAKSLDLFILKFVLCARCKNPETDLKVKGESITSRCRACGKTSNIDMSHKLSTYILKNPPVDKEALNKAGGAQDRKKKGDAPRGAQKAPAQPEEEEVEWSVDTSPAAVEQRRRDLLGNRDRLSQVPGQEDGDETEGKPDTTDGLDVPADKPIPALQAYFASDPKPEECVNQIKAVATKLSWSDTNLIKIIFQALFPVDSIRKDFYKRADYLSLFCTNSKHQKIVLYCLEKAVEFDKKLMVHVPHILNGFYETSILDQDTLVKWHKKPFPVKEIKNSKEIREKAKPFIDWLENTPEESDSDSF